MVSKSRYLPDVHVSAHEDGFVVDVGAHVGIVRQEHELLALENADGESKMMKEGWWMMI